MENVEMVNVKSSMIESVGYDAATKQMRVNFVRSGTYTYQNVPQSTYDNLLSAKSKGGYFNTFIWGVYKYV